MVTIEDSEYEELLLYKEMYETVVSIKKKSGKTYEKYKWHTDFYDYLMELIPDVIKPFKKTFNSTRNNKPQDEEEINEI